MLEKKKPNIIIFNPDEMRWDSMGHMGNPAAYTPNLDHFAKEEAVSFSHAYCQNPVCVPSRCSFTTGLYPHVRGHRTMGYLLHGDETSLFRELKEAGYYVWMNSRNDLIAGQIHGLTAAHADEIYYYNWQKQQKQWNSMQDHGYHYAHYMGVTNVEHGNDSDDLEAAIERILHPVNDQPLCLFLGLVNPHPPYVVEEKYYDRIDKKKMPERIKKEETLGKSRIMEKIREYSGMDDFPEELWEDMRAVYLAQCTMIDDMFGRLCAALKATGIYDECAIFVLSDHGDFAGDYDLPEKAQNTFEDCLVRVPLLVKPPKGDSVDVGVTDSIAELVDFYATVMDYAQVSPTHDHFGISLRPVIEDRKEIIRKYAFCEGGRMEAEEQCDEFHSEGPHGAEKTNCYWARMMAQCDPLAHEKGTMISDGHYKYIERPSGNNEFYLLDEDMGERINRYEEFRHSDQVRLMKDELLKWYQTTCDIVPRKYDRRFTEERIWSIVEGMCPKEKEAEVREAIRNGATIMEAAQCCMGLKKDEAGKE